MRYGMVDTDLANTGSVSLFISTLSTITFSLTLISQVRGLKMKMKMMGKGSVKRTSMGMGKSKGSLPISLGPRPFYLVDSMKDSELKDFLEDCAYNTKEFKKSDWSIGHRGACLQVCDLLRKRTIMHLPPTRQTLYSYYRFSSVP
jgi:hypothetical protein